MLTCFVSVNVAVVSHENVRIIFHPKKYYFKKRKKMHNIAQKQNEADPITVMNSDVNYLCRFSFLKTFFNCIMVTNTVILN